jgi:branched-chain amino acid transport system substrate-binding protein
MVESPHAISYVDTPKRGNPHLPSMKPTFLPRACAALASLAALALLAVGCGPAGDANVIRIGEYASLTGKEATFGQSSHNGTELAVEELKAAGGLLGKQIQLITEDNQSKAGDSQTVVNKLIARDGVVAILGEVASSRSLEAAPVCQNARIPMISPSSTNPDVTRTGDHIFRVCFIDPFQGTVMADFAKNTLKVRKVAIFTDVKSDYSKGLARFFKERHLANGGSIAAEFDFNGGDTDFKAQLTAIKATNPEGVFVPGYYTDVALICIQAKQLGLNVPLFGGDGWESDKLLEIGRDAVEGHHFSTHYHPDVGTPKSREFVEAYRKRYGSPPDAMAALGYDSVMILADAIRRAGAAEPAKIRDALATTRDFEGVTGRITMDANRDATKAAVILKVEGGRFKYLETVSP